jgi:hypothetical protein
MPTSRRAGIATFQGIQTGPMQMNGILVNLQEVSTPQMDKLKPRFHKQNKVDYRYTNQKPPCVVAYKSSAIKT